MLSVDGCDKHTNTQKVLEIFIFDENIQNSLFFRVIGKDFAMFG